MMTTLDIAHLRLHNQLITRRTFETPADVVQWLGAVQSQDYAAAKWALGLRLPGTTDDDIEYAFASGAILRTHVMRPTWHFVAPADIRWMLALTAPRVNAGNASRYRQLELDDSVFLRSNAALVRALQGGKQLTRLELVSVLQQAGITTDKDDVGRFTHIIMRAELDGLVCSGARQGKQFTYALLDERVPQARPFDHDEALATLTSRYFISHGPATVQDFVWWSGLTVAEARAGLAMVKSQLVHEVVDGQTYWFSSSMPPAEDLSQTAHLLPNFDEYTVGYRDRGAVFDASHTNKVNFRGNILFSHAIVLDGQVAGTWRRTLNKDAVTITSHLFTPLNSDEIRAVTAAANHYGAFLGMAVNARL
ncbi:MAG: winged helix DNA-binding domain-containing protein [Chloroflexota bacterium]|nr:winged helix DNA-binding domain-containing protein [Chloroflexota bacterium]